MVRRMLLPSAVIVFSVTSAGGSFTFALFCAPTRTARGISRAERLQRLASGRGQRVQEGLRVVLDAGLPTASAAVAAADTNVAETSFESTFIVAPGKRVVGDRVLRI